MVSVHGGECVWQGGMHGRGDVCGRGHAWQGGMHGMHAPLPGRYYGHGIRSMSGRYASYWNAFSLPTARKKNVLKHLSVILFTWDSLHPGQRLPPELTSSGSHCSDRYASYWNAFLFGKNCAENCMKINKLDQERGGDRTPPGSTDITVYFPLFLPQVEEGRGISCPLDSLYIFLYIAHRWRTSGTLSVRRFAQQSDSLPARTAAPSATTTS